MTDKVWVVFEIPKPWIHHSHIAQPSTANLSSIRNTKNLIKDCFIHRHPKGRQAKFVGLTRDIISWAEKRNVLVSVSLEI